MAKRPTGHIFSSETRRRHQEMQTPEYFEKNILPKIFDNNDIRSLSNPEIESFKNYLKTRKKTIKDILREDSLNSEMFEKGTKAAKRNPKTPEGLLKQFMEQQQFFEEYDEFKQFQNPNSHPKNDYDYGDMKELMKDDEKWRLLRKLAEIDNRLNIDRSYASKILHMIEELVEEQRFSYEEVEEMMMGIIIAHMNKTSDIYDDFHMWDEENEMFAHNKGFHGRDKAEQKWRNRYKNRATNISSYEPMWETPNDFFDFSV